MKIEIKNVEFRYPSKSTYLLRIPGLSFESGSHTALLGPSGSGKSTVLNLVSGVLTPQAGEIAADGLPVNTWASTEREDFRSRNIGILPQDILLLDYLSVQENVLFPLRLHGWRSPSAADRRRAIGLLEKAGLVDLKDAPANRISRGEQQRTALCRALITRPKIVLADEPTSSLDPEGKQEAMDLLQACAREVGATLITATHDTDVVGAYADTLTMRDLEESAVTVC